MLIPPPSPRVWSIADFHWSTNLPMDRYGGVWLNHRQRLIDAWKLRVNSRDLVLVPGDITFAQDPNADLLAMHQLPGQKVLVLGNHDRWAQGISKAKLEDLLSSYPTIHLLEYGTPYYETGEVLIVGYKGSEPPENPRHNPKHYNKTLQHAKSLVEKALYVRASYHKVIVTTHYPPSEEERKILSALAPDLWLHGHTHRGGDDSHLVARWERDRVNPRQKCISSDYLNMVVLEVTGGVLHPHV